ncbi:MAG: amidohydrolase [Bacteroidales bacterium]|nr:amidohydrolase [Bacteroidales bacterium]
MKKILLAATLALLCLQAAAAPKDKRLNSAGMRYLQSNFKTYDRLQKTLHANPELGYLETASSKLLADELQKNGFSIEWGVAGIPTAFIATYGSGSPTIGLLGEYDALPGMSQDTVTCKKARCAGAPGHACGHNLLGTATCASAIAISKWLAEGHEGTVKFFGCPAEEGGGGKAYMTREGCFDGCDAIFDWHPGSTNEVPLSPGLANVRVNFNFTGTPSHASGTPWKGRSALDAVEAFDFMMNLMREHVTPDTRIHYIISNGGQAPNVVPASASCVYYIRHPKAEEVMNVLQRAVNAAEGAALGTGTKMSYEVVNGNYERLINRHLAGMIQKNLNIVGGLDLDEREKAFALEVQRNSPDCKNPEDLSAMLTAVPEPVPPQSGGVSSDVGNVSQVAPLAKLIVSTNVNAGGSHSWQMTATGGTTIGTKGLLNAAKILYLTAMDLYNSPKDIQAIRKEYEEVRGKDFKFVPLMGDRKPPLDYNKK